VETEEGRAELESSIKEMVARKVGPIARPVALSFVDVLPNTRSGKVLQRGIRAISESHDPGDLSTIEDPAALEAIRTITSAR
jgi:propionyl-CoA synthetase